MFFFINISFLFPCKSSVRVSFSLHYARVTRYQDFNLSITVYIAMQQKFISWTEIFSRSIDFECSYIVIYL